MINWNDLYVWYAINGRHSLPWRHDRDVWSIFIAENLLRRTRAEIVSKVYPRIKQMFPDPASVLRHKDEWLSNTKELGFPSRFNNFFEACTIICEKYSGKVPCSEKDLLSLPGIGHYASDAVRCFGYNENRYLVDTNTLRVGSRVSGCYIEQGRHRTKEARNMIKKAFGPEEKMNADANFIILDLASLVCKLGNPNCSACPIRQTCNYNQSN